MVRLTQHVVCKDYFPNPGSVLVVVILNEKTIGKSNWAATTHVCGFFLLGAQWRTYCYIYHRPHSRRRRPLPRCRSILIFPSFSTFSVSPQLSVGLNMWLFVKGLNNVLV